MLTLADRLPNPRRSPMPGNYPWPSKVTVYRVHYVSIRDLLRACRHGRYHVAEGDDRTIVRAL